MKKRFLFIGSTAVLAVGSIFGAKAMFHKKTAVPLYHFNLSNQCTSVTCTTVGTVNCNQLGITTILYNGAGCSSTYNGAEVFEQ